MGQLLFAFFLGLLCLLTSPSEARVVLPHENTEEALVAVNLPLDLVKREVTQLLLAVDSPVKEVKRLDFDPIERVAILEGVLELPADLLSDLSALAGQDSIQHRHRFKITASFPSSRLLATTSYFQLTIHRFELDGQDYSKAFGVLGRLTASLFAHRSFLDYLLDIDQTVQVDLNDPSLRVRQFIERKNIRFRENTISFRLNLKEFVDFRRFAELTELRLWQFAPTLMKGTQIPVFRIEAGLGRPHDNWLNDATARGESDQQTLEQARRETYSRYSYTQELDQQLDRHLTHFLTEFSLIDLNEREKREIEEYKGHRAARLREALGQANPEFLADPLETYHQVIEEEKERAVGFLSDLKRRYNIERVSRGQDGGDKRPFLTKRLSQRALNHAVRFFRDMNLEEKEKLFAELDMVLAPHLPGLILRGRVNLDLNTIFTLALEGTGVELGNVPIRASEDQWGSGIPFQIPVRTYMQDDGVLGLDVKNISLFSGAQRLNINSNSPHGAFMINFIKMIITQTLVTTLIEQPFASARPDGEEETPYKRLLEKVKEQRRVYEQTLRSTTRPGDLERLLHLTQLDIETNPFINTGVDFVEGKTELFFKDLIQYDEGDGLIKFKLDPKVISETVLSSQNTVQVWNLEPLYDRSRDQTYLELSLGHQGRSGDYVKNLNERPIKRDSQLFTGTTGNESEEDVQLKLDLKSFTRLVSHLLTEAAAEQKEQALKEFARDAESEFYIIQGLELRARTQNQLSLSVVLTHLQKKRRGLLGRLFGDEYEEKRKTISLEGKVALEVVKLKDVQAKIERHGDEVFLNEGLIRLDLREVKVLLDGDLGLVDHMVNLIGRRLNFEGQGLASKVKVLVLNVVGNILNPSEPEKSGNVEIAGVKLNRYVKIYTHSENIFIQLHPHLLATGFDIKFPEALEGEELIGQAIMIDPLAESINFNFSTVGNMATVDKSELLSIMARASELVDPLLKIERPERLKQELNQLRFYDQYLYNSDLTKPSLKHRLLRLLSFYQGLNLSSDREGRLMEQIHERLNLEQGFVQEGLDNRQITASGVELMYFLSTSIVMKAKLDQLIGKIRSYGIDREVSYYPELIKASQDLRDRFMIPLSELYELDFSERNRRILKNPPSDWTHSYYSDALYSNSIYQHLKDVLKAEKEKRGEHGH